MVELARLCWYYSIRIRRMASKNTLRSKQDNSNLASNLARNQCAPAGLNLQQIRSRRSSSCVMAGLVRGLAIQPTLKMR
jgi:hypothetical protein